MVEFFVVTITNSFEAVNQSLLIYVRIDTYNLELYRFHRIPSRSEKIFLCQVWSLLLRLTLRGVYGLSVAHEF